MSEEDCEARSRSSPLDHLGLRSHHFEGAAVESSRLAHGLPNGEVDVRCPLYHFQHHHHDYARRHFWNPIERPYCSSMEGLTVSGFELSNNSTLRRRIRVMTLPRMYLLLIASVAGVQLLLRIGSPHKALKGQETTCTCCSEKAEMQESVNGWWEKMGGAEWCEIEGLAASFLVGDSGLSWMRKRVIVFSRCRSYLCISSCD